MYVVYVYIKITVISIMIKFMIKSSDLKGLEYIAKHDRFSLLSFRYREIRKCVLCMYSFANLTTHSSIHSYLPFTHFVFHYLNLVYYSNMYIIDVCVYV